MGLKVVSVLIQKSSLHSKRRLNSSMSQFLFVSSSIIMNFASSVNICVGLLMCWQASMVFVFLESFAMIVDAQVKLNF